MAQLEKAVAAVLCLACLAAPIALLVSGVLEPEEPELGGGTVVYKASRKKALDVRGAALDARIPVSTNNSGGRFREVSGHQMPVDAPEQAPAHHDAFDMPVRHHRKRGLTPEANAEE